MDLQFTPQEQAFRERVLQFLAQKLPKPLSEKVHNGTPLSRDDMTQWHAVLHREGWLANHWPRDYGGPGWTAIERFIFENECALAGAPRFSPPSAKLFGRPMSSTKGYKVFLAFFYTDSIKRGDNIKLYIGL